MEKTKKILLILIAITVAILNRPAYAVSEKIAIFPIDKTFQGSTLTPYPNIINLVSSDLANTLGSNSPFVVIDLKSSDSSLKANGLYPKYRKLLQDYRNSDTLDYDILEQICDKIGASKVLIVSGGFDLQTSFLRTSRFNFDTGFDSLLNTGFDSGFVRPSYRLNIILSLIDAQTGLVVWEKIYKKDLEYKNYYSPSPDVSENVIANQNLKQFSKTLSFNAKNKIEFLLSKSQYTQVHSKLITTQNNSNMTTDGITTKDGHSYSTNNDLVNKRKTDYKNWVQNSL